MTKLALAYAPCPVEWATISYLLSPGVPDTLEGLAPKGTEPPPGLGLDQSPAVTHCVTLCKGTSLSHGVPACKMQMEMPASGRVTLASRTCRGLAPGTGVCAVFISPSTEAGNSTQPASSFPERPRGSEALHSLTTGCPRSVYLWGYHTHRPSGPSWRCPAMQGRASAEWGVSGTISDGAGVLLESSGGQDALKGRLPCVLESSPAQMPPLRNTCCMPFQWP